MLGGAEMLAFYSKGCLIKKKLSSIRPTDYIILHSTKHWPTCAVLVTTLLVLRLSTYYNIGLNDGFNTENALRSKIMNYCSYN